MVEDRIHCHAERGVAGIAVMPLFALNGGCAVRFAVGASWLSLPANLLKMSDAIGCGWKSAVDFNDVHGYLLLGLTKVCARPNSMSREIDYLKLGHSDNLCPTPAWRTPRDSGHA